MPVATATKTISVRQMIDLVVQHRGTSFFTVTIDTGASSLRKNATDGSGKVNQYYKNTRKAQTFNLMTGFDYDKRVQKVRAADGLEPRDIGPATNGAIHIDGTPFVYFADTLHICLWCELRSISATAYRTADTGEAIEADYFKPFKPTTKTELAYITPGVENIRTITIGGAAYDVDASTYPAAVDALRIRLANDAKEAPQTVPAVAVLPDTTPTRRPASQWLRDQRDMERLDNAGQ